MCCELAIVVVGFHDETEQLRVNQPDESFPLKSHPGILHHFVCFSVENQLLGVVCFCLPPFAFADSPSGGVENRPEQTGGSRRIRSVRTVTFNSSSTSARGCLGYIGDETLPSYVRIIISYAVVPESILNNQYHSDTQCMVYLPTCTPYPTVGYNRTSN